MSLIPYALARPLLFKMDPEAIADRLLSNAQELLSRTREQ